MIDNIMELTLESDVFEDARAKFDGVLQKLFKSMLDSKSDEGSITLKINVDMQSMSVPHYKDGEEKEEREIHVPSFSYKVSSQVAVKNEQKGNKNPEMELAFDPDSATFVLQYINNTTQRSMFDDDFQSAEEIEEGQKVIEGEGRLLIEEKEDKENGSTK